MKINVANAFSGLALGALVGFLIGLSISQVVGILLGALTSLLVTFFGLRETQSTDAATGNNPSKTLISSFSIGCIVFILIGVHLRSRNSLAPSADYYRSELSDLHLDSNQVKRIVLLKRYGIAWEDKDEETVKSEPSAQVNSSLYSAGNTEREKKTIVQQFEKFSLSQLGDFMSRQGQGYLQLFNTIDTDVNDSTTKKNILLQLIAITYNNEKASQ